MFMLVSLEETKGKEKEDLPWLKVISTKVILKMTEEKVQEHL